MTLSKLLPSLGKRTVVMGILNVTPDSFSDGGEAASVEAAIAKGRRLFAEGADVVDVGGESTRPGAAHVPASLELERVLPVLEGLRGVGPLSIDTTKAEVARRALAAGAGLVNDVSGGLFEPEILEVASHMGAPIVLMHTRDRPERMQLGEWRYEGGVVAAVARALAERVEAALAAGIARASIAVDPGIGFGKTAEENLELLARLDALSALGLPILVGTSRKSFLGALTGRPPAERAFGTAASVALSIARGAAIVRVHDVSAMVDVCRVSDAIEARRAPC